MAGAGTTRRGRGDKVDMLEELTIEGLGVIEHASARLHPGFHRAHRRDRCRQDDDRYQPPSALGARADAGRGTDR